MSRVLVFGLGPMRWENSRRLFALPLRTWHFASTLAADGHEVLLVSMRTAAFEGWPAEHATRAAHAGVTVLSLSEALLAERADWVAAQIAEFAPDCVVGVNRDPAALACRFAGELPFWADINGDPMAEAQAKAEVCAHDGWTPTFVERFVPTLRRADVFSACSGPQRAALIGQLSMLGRLNAANAGYELVHAVANSIGDEALASLGATPRGERPPDSDFVVLWSGGYNTWCDPDLLFEALELAMQRAPRLRFVSTGGAIEGHHEGAFARFQERVRRSPQRDRYRFDGWVETSELARVYAEADVAILTDRRGYEGALGARTRMLDWLAAGLPIVATRLSEISLELERVGAARLADCGDPPGLAAHLVALAEDPAAALEMGRRGRAHATTHLRASTQLGHLRAWAAAPTRAPDRGRAVPIDLSEAPREAELRRLSRVFVARTREAGLYASLGETRRFLRDAARRRIGRALGERTSVPPLELREVHAPGAPASPRQPAEWSRVAAESPLPAVHVHLVVRPEDSAEAARATAEHLLHQRHVGWSVEVCGAPSAAARRALEVLRSRVAESPSDGAHVVLGAGERLAPDALAELALASRSADCVYGDARLFDEASGADAAARTPPFDPERLLSEAYLGPLACFATPPEPGRLASWSAGAVVHASALALGPDAHFAHVPLELSRRALPRQRDERAARVAARELREATRAALEARGVDGEVSSSAARPHVVRWAPRAPSGALLRLALVGARAAVEVTTASLAEEPLVELVERALPVGPGITATLDAALREGAASHVGWIAPGLERVGRGPLSELLAHASRPDVAAAAPYLLDARGALRWPEAARVGSHRVERLPAACAVMSRAAYLAAGGLDPALPFERAVAELSAALGPGALVGVPHVTLYGAPPGPSLVAPKGPDAHA